jgi:CRISPR/Cas system Type II protein with McrA/HNH and RuvC-like nuclease domain
MKKDIKKQLFDSQRGKCASCGMVLSDADYTRIEHFLPAGRGGSNEIENLILVCAQCNSMNNIKGYEFENYIYDIFVLSEKFTKIHRKAYHSSKFVSNPSFPI